MARDLFLPRRVTSTTIADAILVDTTTHISLDARIYRPATKGLHPIVVQIHGGSWQGGTPADNDRFATWLASAGHVVLAIDYRHAPQWRWPAQIDDVNRWLAWIADHAGDWDGDTSRVVLLGRSAGAHLAMMAAWRGAPMPRTSRSHRRSSSTARATTSSNRSTAKRSLTRCARGERVWLISKSRGPYRSPCATAETATALTARGRNSEEQRCARTPIRLAHS